MHRRLYQLRQSHLVHRAFSLCFRRLRWVELVIVFFFFNDTATTEIYTLSLHDALPICWSTTSSVATCATRCCSTAPRRQSRSEEHRLNSSHSQISYAVFCLKKKKTTSKQWTMKLDKTLASVRCIRDT